MNNIDSLDNKELPNPETDISEEHEEKCSLSSSNIIEDVVKKNIDKRYYYIAFSYIASRADGFGNLTTKITATSDNEKAELIPSIMIKRIKETHSLRSVTILNWIELTEDQYMLEIKM